ncbi:clostripain-related cysteine peptidase [Methanospirillum lacunae]|nr:clostripain-related cysteine peptidase [Methanospirillum lacunae]
MRYIRDFIVIFAVLLSALLVVSATETPIIGNETPSHTKSLVMIYMVGSDLESEDGAGTDNIKQINEGVGDIVPGDLQIVVGYGGANKTGWKGMTIASYDQLKKDLQNEVIGDESISSFSDPSIDMGSPVGLKTFIDWVSKRYSADHTYLIFWDHGGGYGGFGSDENSGNMLSLANIASVFNETQFKPEVIGFDACLMSELEVAATLSPYGTYFIGSEEIEPGSGWEYAKWMKVLAQNPSQNPINVSRIIVDTFVDAPGDSGRTLSVLDLELMPDIANKLEDLGASLTQVMKDTTGFRLIGKAYRNSTKFAQEPGNNGGTSVDLSLLVQYLMSHVSGAEKAGSSINESINKAVLYERHDKYISDARGLSIMDPQGTSHDQYLEDGVNVKVTPGWDSFITDFLLKQSTDNEKPELNSTGVNSYELTDPSGTASVWVEYFAYDPQTNDLIALGETPAVADTEGTYSIPEWDGTWFYLKDSSASDKYALLGMFYEDSTDDGIEEYSSKVNVTHDGLQDNVYLYSYIDPETGKTDLEFRPYTIDSTGEVLISRATIIPARGDKIDTYSELFNPDSNESDWINLGNMTVEGTVELVPSILPDGIYATGLYADYGNGYGSVTDLQKIEINDGQVTRDGSLTI